MTRDELLELEGRISGVLLDIEKAYAMATELSEEYFEKSREFIADNPYWIVGDYWRGQIKIAISIDYLFGAKKALETLENDILDHSEGGDAL